MTAQADPSGGLRWELDGPVLPWVLPMVALGWCCGQAQDQAGRLHLRQTVADLRASGAGALPEDFLSGLPAEDEPAEAALLVAVDACAGLTQVDDNGWQALVTGHGINMMVDQVHPQRRQNWDDLWTASRPLELAGPGQVVAAELRQAHREDRLDLMGALREPFLFLPRKLSAAARELALVGDGRAGPLADLACHIGRHHLGYLATLLHLRHLADRDAVALALLARGKLDEAWTRQWLDAPAPEFDLAAVRGERLLLIGWMAQHLLELPGAGPPRLGDTDLSLLFLRPLISLEGISARSAEDVATLMRSYHTWETTGVPGNLDGVRSLLGAMTWTLGSGIIHSQGAMHRSQSTHHLSRLAARLLQAAELPIDHATAETLFGPLRVPHGADWIPLRYERLTHGGFRLSPDTAAPEWNPQWRHLLPREPMDGAFIVGYGMEVRIELRAIRQP